MKAPLSRYEETDFDLDEQQRQFAEDVAYGLSQPEKRLPCKYIYDDVGSELFSRIMELPEYYPTQCEMEIFATHKSDLAKIFGHTGFNIVELGAGDGQKTRVLIDELLDRTCDFTYVPLDISEAAVNGISDRFADDFPKLSINGIVSDYFEGLRWLADQNHCRNVVLFLGSTIGNFTTQGRSMFLKNLRRSINTGDLVLIGFDLVKEIDTLVRAYNDSQGVTAAFNQNILKRINSELDADFDLDNFIYYSTWDAVSRAIKSYQVSSRRQEVHIGKIGQTFEFEPLEAVHTESSHKFNQDQIATLAGRNGFAIEACYTDARQYYMDCLWRAI